MAISVRSTSSVALASRTNTTATAPSGAASGDVLVASLTCGGAGAAVEPTGPAGWTLIDKLTYADGGWTVAYSMWVAPFDSIGSWTWTHASHSTQISVQCLIGVDTTTPLDVAAAANTDSALIPSITTATDGALSIASRASWDGQAITPPTGWTEHYDAPILWVGSILRASAGATGTATIGTGNFQSWYPYGIIHTALRPAGAGGGTTYQASGTVAAVSAVSGAVSVQQAAPQVTAGLDRPVVNGGTVDLDAATVAPSGGTITGHQWTITTGPGSLSGATTATPTYTPPASGSGTAVIEVEVTASTGGTATDTLTVAYGPTIVAAENRLAGTPRATWDLPTSGGGLAGIDTLQGFADGFTADKSETVSFKIAQSDAAGWTGEVYRLGWYDGDGARSYGTPTTTDVAGSQAQPAPGDADSVTTKLSADCGNWSATATWTPPAWAPSGMYVLRLNRTGGGASHALFVLRDDARAADLMLMPSDSTWQAYNAFGGMGGSLYAGNSFYYGTPVDQYNADCARYVSYDRPIINRGAVHGGYGAVQWSTFFTGEYPMVRFLERHGADVKYYGCIDAMGDPTGALLGNVSAAMMVGHNEYWSANMRAGWEAARAAGVSLFSCAGNEVFWRTIGDQPDSDGRPRRIECYKSTIASRGSTGRTEWTGTWRDPDGAGKGGDQPENGLTGTIFVVNGPFLRSLSVPYDGGYSQQPMWRDTSVASLTSGQSWTSPSEILGFEWDTYGPAGAGGTGGDYMADPHPSARYCSDVSHAVSSGLLLVDAGDVYGSGTATHRLVAYPGEQGQLCFGTGTINWAFGCDDANTYQVGSDNTSAVIQQATLNVLADMGVTLGSVDGLTEPAVAEWFPPLVASGTVAAVSGASGDVTATLGAGGTVAATSGVAGEATALLPTTGSVDAATDVTGSVDAVLQVTGSVDAVSAVAGEATATLPSSGTVAAVSGAAGVVTLISGAADAASGTVSAVSSVSGDVTAIHAMSGTVAVTAGAAGSVTARLVAAGTAAAVSALVGDVSVQGTLSGSVVVVSGVYGSPTAIYQIVGTVAAVSGVAGTLYDPSALRILRLRSALVPGVTSRLVPGITSRSIQ